MKKKGPEDFGMTSKQYQEITDKYEEWKSRHESFLDTSHQLWGAVAILFGVLILIKGPDEGYWSIFLFLLYLPIGFVVFGYVSDLELFAPEKYNPPNAYIKYIDYDLKQKEWQNEWQKKEDERIQEENRRLEEEKRRIERKKQKYWSTINPYEFEREIAELFKKHGFKTNVTKGSDDGGIDIILTKLKKKSIVQCKRYQEKVGPSTIRDLYGAMVSGKYHSGYVVCTGGFSKKANEFSKDKNIVLIGLSRILKMVENEKVSFLK